MRELIDNLEKKLDNTIELFKNGSICYNDTSKYIINIERNFNRMLFDMMSFNLIDMDIVEEAKSQASIVVCKYMDRLELISRTKDRCSLQEAFATLLDFDFIGNM